MGKWETVKLGEICEIINGYAFKSASYTNSGVRIIRITNVQKGIVCDDDPKYHPACYETDKFKLYENDLLVSLTGNVGRVGLIEENLLPAALNQRVACLRPNKSICKKFLFYFLNTDAFEAACIKESKGLTQKNMSTQWLQLYRTPCPPIKTQLKVINLLDKIYSCLSARKAQIEKLDLLIKSQFVVMFGDIINNTRNWDTVILSDVSASRLGKMLDAKKQQGNSRYPYLANFNVQWFELNLSKLNEMDFDEKDRIEFALKKGDLLVCEGGEVGRCAIWNDELVDCYFQKAIHRVRCNVSYINPFYLQRYLYFRSVKTGFKDVIGTATISHLTGKQIKSLVIPLPPIELQNQFADFVHQVEQQKSLLQKSLIKMEETYKSLMQKCFRGEIFS